MHAINIHGKIKGEEDNSDAKFAHALFMRDKDIQNQKTEPIPRLISIQARVKSF